MGEKSGREASKNRREVDGQGEIVEVERLLRIIYFSLCEIA